MIPARMIDTAALVRILARDLPIEKRGLGELERRLLATVRVFPRLDDPDAILSALWTDA